MKLFFLLRANGQRSGSLIGLRSTEKLIALALVFRSDWKPRERVAVI